jgi:hypothetical protein
LAFAVIIKAFSFAFVIIFSALICREPLLIPIHMVLSCFKGEKEGQSNVFFCLKFHHWVIFKNKSSATHAKSLDFKDSPRPKIATFKQ